MLRRERGSYVLELVEEGPFLEVGRETLREVASISLKESINVDEVDEVEGEEVEDEEVEGECLVCGRKEEVVRRGAVSDESCLRGIGDPGNPPSRKLMIMN